jgi:hypothetical protein
VKLYDSPYHSVARDGDLFTYVRTALPWPDVDTARTEMEALESSLGGLDTRGFVLLIDTRLATADEGSVRATATVRDRLVARFRRSAVLVATSPGATQTTKLVLENRRDMPVFRDERAARHYLGV